MLNSAVSDGLCVLQQEQVEWDDVNKRLQHHGFKPVFFADPAENKSPAGKNKSTRLYQRSRVTVAESEQSYQAEDCNNYTWKQKSELKTTKDRVYKVKVAQQYSYCVKCQ